MYGFSYAFLPFSLSSSRSLSLSLSASFSLFIYHTLYWNYSIHMTGEQILNPKILNNKTLTHLREFHDYNCYVYCYVSGLVAVRVRWEAKQKSYVKFNQKRKNKVYDDNIGVDLSLLNFSLANSHFNRIFIGARAWRAGCSERYVHKWFLFFSSVGFAIVQSTTTSARMFWVQFSQSVRFSEGSWLTYIYWVMPTVFSFSYSFSSYCR